MADNERRRAERECSPGDEVARAKFEAELVRQGFPTRQSAYLMLLGVLRRKLISDIRARAIKNYEDWVREVRLVVPEYAIDDIILPLEQLECETCLGAADGSCLYAFDSYNTKGGWCLADWNRLVVGDL